MRALVNLTLVLSLGGCQLFGFGQVSSRGDDASQPPPQLSSAEQQCMRSIAFIRRQYCDERPDELPEGFAARARDRYRDLDYRCSGTPAWRALRHLDECIASYESEANQLDRETVVRREAAAEAAQVLVGEKAFQEVLKKKRQAVVDADAAAEEYRTAKREGLRGSELKYVREEWDAAELEVHRAQARLVRTLKSKHFDLRDARALGLW